MTNVKYEEKCVAFVDILGFKEIVERSHKNNSPEDILEIMELMCSRNDRLQYKEYGPEICSESPKSSPDISFQVSQISDSLILSTEVSATGAINLLNFCRKVSERLLRRKGLLCRGHVVKGPIYHRDDVFFGKGYQKAYEGEKLAARLEVNGKQVGAPFIEVSDEIFSLIKLGGDSCINTVIDKMVSIENEYVVVSPYGVFDRLGDWAVSPDKTLDEANREISDAKKNAQMTQQILTSASPQDESSKTKIEIATQMLQRAINKLDDKLQLVKQSRAPFPANHL